MIPPFSVDPGRGDATWRDAVPPPVARPQGLRDWIRVLRRGAGAVLALLAGVLLILPLRGIERLFHGQRRPWTGPLVQIVCRLALACIGIRWQRHPFDAAEKGEGASLALLDPEAALTGR